jgi:hypothetical protein
MTSASSFPQILLFFSNPLLKKYVAIQPNSTILSFDSTMKKVSQLEKKANQYREDSSYLTAIAKYTRAISILEELILKPSCHTEKCREKQAQLYDLIADVYFKKYSMHINAIAEKQREAQAHNTSVSLVWLRQEELQEQSSLRLTQENRAKGIVSLKGG